MKKEYIRPIATVLDVTVNSMLAESGGGDINIGGGSGNGNFVPRNSNVHRGDWDNIWGE